MKNFLICVFALSQLTTIVYAGCTIQTSNNRPSTHIFNDPIYQLLTTDKNCPTDVLLFRQRIQESGLQIATTMVANRGFHNPSEGSFSLFEIVSGQFNQATIGEGDFFFGHFTGVNDQDQLYLDQSPARNNLMIEAFAWDAKKQMYNFYELRGNGIKGQWFYRGDSSDILADNENLHRQADPEHPTFGNRLRCSACHSEGGPIMKELDSPHNDWWEPKRELDFGGRKPDAELANIMNNLVPANRLKTSVVKGLQKLNQNPGFSEIIAQHTLQEQLRPLFCPVEVNFASDVIPKETRDEQIQIPINFLIDPRLVSETDQEALTIPKSVYEKILTNSNSHFPETTFNDADHAWLSPIKATSDQIAIDALVKRGVIDTKFVTDVLSIDMTNPVFSDARCQLLRLVPEKANEHWQIDFIKNLSESDNTNAKELASKLTNTNVTLTTHQQDAAKFLQQCRTKLNNSHFAEQLFALLVQRRLEISTSEISKNPRGQILEPGFRVIFPETDIKAEPGKLKLTETCDIK